MPFRAIANWWKNRRRRTMEAAVGAPRSPDDLADRAMRAFDAAKRYKSDMARRAQSAPRRSDKSPLVGTMGDSAAWRRLNQILYPRKNNPGFDLTSHHIVQAYLRRLASGGAADRNFEARTLQTDLKITPVQVAAILYGYARERGIPTQRAFQYLLPPAPDEDDALASHFMKIMCAVEVGNLPERDYLSILLEGYLSETDDVDLLFSGLLPHADNVGFIVNVCRSLDRLGQSGH